MLSEQVNRTGMDGRPRTRSQQTSPSPELEWVGVGRRGRDGPARSSEVEETEDTLW